MCGIAGLIDPGRPSVEIRRTLQGMMDALRHRGPDDEGFFAADGAGLGIRRLSIIDVTGGHQPLTNEDGSVQVVFNGEIYNYRELFNRLAAKGHIFRTRSDTEAIAHAYEETGVECLSDLWGMFGLAVYDRREGRLLLARDRLGKKPLFYAAIGNRLIFGSEIKAILAADPSLAEADPEALLPYFTYGFVSEPGTMFRHIKKLPAGHWLIAQGGRVTVGPYWQVPVGVADTSRSRRQWTDELDALLEDAVRVRLMSEVPLGLFLSGGLDSSAVVAYAHRAGLRPLKTFTIGFDLPAWDESADAKVVAEHFQTEHHTLTLRGADLVADLPDTMRALVRQFDEPFGDASALPTYHICRLARQHVTVMLSGDGGDELFAGYGSYRGIRFAERYRRLPTWLAARLLPRLAAGLAASLPAGRRYGALRAVKVLRDSALPFERMYFSKMSIASEATLRALFNADAVTGLNNGSPQGPADVATVMCSPLPVFTKAAYADFRFRLVDEMLVKVDRMSMANSLEVRSPFLDHRLVEFVARIPMELKIRGWETKAILRDVLRRHLPARTLAKPKQGFVVPLREWFRTHLREIVEDYLGVDGGPLPAGVFQRSTIRAYLREHRLGVADHSRLIFLLVTYAMWCDLYGRRQPIPHTDFGAPVACG